MVGVSVLVPIDVWEEWKIPQRAGLHGSFEDDAEKRMP
jgi:hypothetical protein